jgi:putative hydrolase of the HAD superfamily
MKRLHALLFDAGDVLYYRPRRGQAIGAFLAARGCALAPQNPELRIAAYRGTLSQADFFRERLRRSGLADDAALDEGVAVMVQAQADIELFDGVPETLHALKHAGLKLGIVTNTNDATARKLRWFARWGIEGVWDSFATSCELRVVKPEPAIYRHALEPLGLPPERVGFVGHSARELEGARALGMAAISFNPDTPDVASDAHAARFADLLSLAQGGGD